MNSLEFSTIVLVADTEFVPSELRHTVDTALEKLGDPQRAVEKLDELLGVTDAPKPTGTALGQTPIALRRDFIVYIHEDVIILCP